MVEQEYLPNASFLLAVDDSATPLGFMGMTEFINFECWGKGLGRKIIDHAHSTTQSLLTVDVNE